jgi:flavin reductase (DIM6/NTAB) family NADH-FMN oxidoreductase RutF
MAKIDPQNASTREVYLHMVSSIAPRPIAFASTVDKEGQTNLAPFSFFNAFGPNPPIVVFSPVRRGSDGTIKDTYRNLEQVKEVVINVVTYDIVQQNNIASTEYPYGTSEFNKSGLTPVEAEKVAPPLVKESPVNFECKVNDIIVTGEEGGAGNLVVAEIMLMHVEDRLYDEEGYIDPHEIRLVGRMGGHYYSKAFGDAVFKVVRPGTNLGIGVDQMPEEIRYSEVLSGNDLGRLGTILQLPESDEVAAYIEQDKKLKDILENTGDDDKKLQKQLHQYAHQLLEQEKVEQAWKVLLAQKTAVK